MKFTGFVLAIGLLVAHAATAHAQSHQGGYLGAGSGAHQSAATTPSPELGSRQGGYLGAGAGARLGIDRLDVLPDERTATGWCVRSPEPSHCYGRAAVEHQVCSSSANYDACRLAVDQMHNTK